MPLKSKLKTVSPSISRKEAGKTPSLSSALKSNSFFYQEETPKTQKTKAISFPLNVNILSIKSPKLKPPTWKAKISTKSCISSKNNSINYIYPQIFLSQKSRSIFMKLSNLLQMSLFNPCNPFLTNSTPCTLHQLKHFLI